MSKKDSLGLNNIHKHILGTSKQAKLAKKYGVEGVRFSHPDGRSGKPTRLPSQVAEEVANAMAEDYNVRETLKYAADAGNKRAQDIGTIDDIESAYEAAKFMKKTHNKKMGLGAGDYKGNAEDDAGVADYWFNQSRDKFGSGFSSENDLKALSVEEQQSPVSNKPYIESKSLSDAKERVQSWLSSQSNSSPYRQG